MEAAVDTSVVDITDPVGVFGDEVARSLEADIAAAGADDRRFGTMGGEAVGDEADAATNFVAAAGTVPRLLPLVDITAGPV